VIDAALALLAERPDASMQEIADASGLGRTTVYRHFPTREDLFAGLLEVAIDHSWRTAESIFDKGLAFEPTIRELSLAMVEISATYRFLLGYGNPQALQVSRSAADNPIMAWLERERSRGTVRRDLPIHWLMSCFQALALVAMQDFAAGRQSREETASLLAESILALFRESGEILPAEDSGAVDGA
jgi:AcrR family transcriptional regulator